MNGFDSIRSSTSSDRTELCKLPKGRDTSSDFRAAGVIPHPSGHLSPTPDPPPRSIGPRRIALQVLAIREILLHHALGVIAQVLQAERIVRRNHDDQPFLVGRRARVGLERVLNTIGGRNISPA